MNLRKIGKMNIMNDGNRSFYESIMNRYVLTSVKYLSHNKKLDYIVINDLAISFHTKPFATIKIDILVLDKNIKIKYLKNITKNNVILNILDINDVDISPIQFNNILNNSYISDNIRIISPTDMSDIFLKKFNDIDNRSAVYTLCTNCPIKLNELSSDESKNIFSDFIFKIKLDYNMTYLKKFNEYFTVKIFEGTSGYPEVDDAFKGWVDRVDVDQVLIGGMDLVNYIDNRTTTDVDFIFLSNDDIPTNVNGFKRTRNSAFQHNKTHVEIELLTPKFLNIPQEMVKIVFETAYDKGGFKIASPSSIVALKLRRFNIRDEKDIRNLISAYNVDISLFIPYLTTEEINNFESCFKN